MLQETTSRRSAQNNAPRNNEQKEAQNNAPEKQRAEGGTETMKQKNNNQKAQQPNKQKAAQAAATLDPSALQFRLSQKPSFLKSKKRGEISCWNLYVSEQQYQPDTRLEIKEKEQKDRRKS